MRKCRVLLPLILHFETQLFLRRMNVAIAKLMSGITDLGKGILGTATLGILAPIPGCSFSRILFSNSP